MLPIAFQTMMQEEVLAKLIALVEGKIAPAAWVNWWNENSTQLQKLLPRTAFLRIKPNTSFGDTRAALVSQTGALEYLNKQGITAVRADKYATAWQKEEVAQASQTASDDELARKYFANNFQQLKHYFPSLYACLKKCLSNTDVVALGKSVSDILGKEQSLSCIFSGNQRLFMQSVSALQLDSVKYDFNDIRWLEVASVRYLVWGEYWLEGDGDLLLFDPVSDQVHYLGHSSKAPQPQTLSVNFYEFIERHLVRFISESEG